MLCVNALRKGSQKSSMRWHFLLLEEVCVDLTDFWIKFSPLFLSEMLKTWWFAGAASRLRSPAANSHRDPAVHYNRAVITPTLLARFLAPPQLSALRFQPSGHVIVPASLTLSLPASHNFCPSIISSHLCCLVTLPLALFWPTLCKEKHHKLVLNLWIKKLNHEYNTKS